MTNTVLEEDRLIGIKEVERLTGYVRMTIYRKFTNGLFPKPVKIQERNKWYLSAVKKWVDDSMKGITYAE